MERASEYDELSTYSLVSDDDWEVAARAAISSSEEYSSVSLFVSLEFSVEFS